MAMVQMKFYTAIYPLPENPYFIQSHPTNLSLFGQFQDWITYLLTRLYYPNLWFPPHSSQTEADYAPQLWTIEIEFYSSMLLFITLIGLSRTRSTIRNAVVAVELSFSLYIGRWDIALFLSGILIATTISTTPSTFTPQEGETSTDLRENLQGATRHTLGLRHILFQIIWTLTLILGLVIASFTSNNGTSPLYTPLKYITHSSWTWEAIGSSLLVLSITKLPALQQLLESSGPQYLGRISYPLYIVHFPILSVGGWSLLPWIWGMLGREGWGMVIGYLIAFLVLTPVVLWVADLWERLVDINCVSFGRWLERKVSLVEESV